jgi:peptide/nickel transport system permease protein
VAASSGSLRRYLITRLLLVVPMVFILLTFVFIMLRVAPGDPVSAALGARLPPKELAVRRHEAGYDQPIIVQYGEYLGSVVTGNFGTTLTDHRPLSDVISVNGAATLELTISAMIVALVVGIPLGMLAARLRDTWLDALIRTFGIVIYAAPVFFLGLIAQLIFGEILGWLPVSSQASVLCEVSITPHTNMLVIDALIDGNWGCVPDVLAHLAMPAITLGLVIAGVTIRLVRVNVIQTLRGDYVEAARARGLKERTVVYRHAFKNALVPIFTVMGLQAALLLSGAVLTEVTFNWPGIGSELFYYLQGRDYIAVQGIITVFALVVVFISLVIDFVNAWIDPRVRYT